MPELVVPDLFSAKICPAVVVPRRPDLPCFAKATKTSSTVQRRRPPLRAEPPDQQLAAAAWNQPDPTNLAGIPCRSCPWPFSCSASVKEDDPSAKSPAPDRAAALALTVSPATISPSPPVPQGPAAAASRLAQPRFGLPVPRPSPLTASAWAASPRLTSVGPPLRFPFGLFAQCEQPSPVLLDQQVLAHVMFFSGSAKLDIIQEFTVLQKSPSCSCINNSRVVHHIKTIYICKMLINLCSLIICHFHPC
nr:uncharacterized protein LOC109772118 [Aegilops tauschii subsp. strangulata]